MSLHRSKLAAPLSRWQRHAYTLLIALGLSLACSAAAAHKPSDAYMRLQIKGGQVEQRFDIALRDLDRDLVLDADNNGALDWREVRSRWSEIDRLALAGASLAADNKICTAGPSAAPALERHSDGTYAVIMRAWSCPTAVQTLAVRYTLFAQSDPTHRGILQLRRGDQSESAVLVPAAGVRTFAASASSTASANGLYSIGQFITEGVRHILIGADHILFLLALLLPVVLTKANGLEPRQPATAIRPVLLNILSVVTAFTVAHSITLALAAFNLVSPPSRWIESIIAASVVLAALNNLYPLIQEGRWKLTFIFGLVHGFGFASALKDLGLSRFGLVVPLVGFNLGVELGQLAIVTLFILLMWPLRQTQFYRRGVLRWGSAAIALLALVWLLERALNIKLLMT